MHRQSLDSPLSKHHHHLLQLSHAVISSLTPPSYPQHQPDELKSKSKPLLLRRQSERFIHVIPLLTILSFLILYLSSHNPSQLEMAHFNGFKTTNNPIDSIGEMEQLMETKNNDVLSMRSLRNLHEIDEEEDDDGAASSNNQQLHRKIGDF